VVGIVCSPTSRDAKGVRGAVTCAKRPSMRIRVCVAEGVIMTCAGRAGKIVSERDYASSRSPTTSRRASSRGSSLTTYCTCRGSPTTSCTSCLALHSYLRHRGKNQMPKIRWRSCLRHHKQRHLCLYSEDSGDNAAATSRVETVPEIAFLLMRQSIFDGVSFNYI